MWWCSGESIMFACQRFRVRLWVLTCYFPFSFSKKKKITSKNFSVSLTWHRPFTKWKHKRGASPPTNQVLQILVNSMLYFCASLTLSATFKTRHSLKTDRSSVIGISQVFGLNCSEISGRKPMKTHP